MTTQPLNNPRTNPNATDDTATSLQEGFSWRIFGPGILMATAAIGGSHLISSTQAGAIYGWQLAIMIILANVFKYPFFRFATDYVYDTGEFDCRLCQTLKGISVGIFYTLYPIGCH